MCPPASDLANQTLAAIQCSLDSDICVALCANPDLAGVGVRAAFYVQSIMNTLLVIVSPRDSVPSAWASTLLTAALIIAAIVQKAQAQLTLHHATLIMNFATLSCISSLAVAPILPIWRLRPNEYYARELERHALAGPDALHFTDHGNILESEVYVNKHKRKIKAAQNRERVILALALLTQVVLQWAWGVILFVSPSYSQKECSGDTVLLFFLHPFPARDITGWTFTVWPLWLLFSLGITLGLTIILALSSPSRAHDMPSRRSTITAGSGISPSSPIVFQLTRLAYNAMPAWGDRPKQLIFWGNVVSCVLWLIFLISSELQRKENCVFDGEDNFGGFGQITAVLLALAPLWSLTVALYKYPSLRRRRERHLRELTDPARRDQSEEGRRLLISPITSPRNSDDHTAHPPPEEHEMTRFDTPAVLPPSPSQATQQHQRRRVGGAHIVTVPSPDTGLLEWMERAYVSDVPQHTQ